MGIEIFNNIVFSQGNSANKNLKLFGCCNMQTKFRNKCYLNKNLFFTISREIHNRGTWDQARCCFLIFSYIPILFLEKNSTHKREFLQSLIGHNLILVEKWPLKIGKLPILISRTVAHR
ncbi:hypothetical protein T06_5334 [Trichinella sp. T6]|nr:hypothetical protein T06_5334 [Trichinella sp. T6]